MNRSILTYTLLKKISFAFAFCIFIAACGGSSDKSNAIILSGSKVYIELPSNYLPFQADELDSLLGTSSSAHSQIALMGIKSMLLQDKNMLVYLDSSNYLNQLTMTTGQKLQLNSKTAEGANKAFKESLGAAAGMYGGKVIAKELAIKNGATHRYMKLKYKFSLADVAFYQTYYFVNGIKGTYGFAVVNESEEDFENAISSVEIK